MMLYITKLQHRKPSCCMIFNSYRRRDKSETAESDVHTATEGYKFEPATEQNAWPQKDGQHTRCHIHLWHSLH